jgi:predicted NBD/HSP70 family sugar kinase
MKAYQIDTTVNAKLQNKINRSVLFYHIRKNPSSYRAQIARELKISAPAVSRAIDHLIRQGYVVEKERAVTSSGKKAARLCVNPDTGVVIGIDLIKERIRTAVSNFAGQMISVSVGSRFTENVDAFSVIAADIDRVLAGEGLSGQVPGSAQRLKAIGIGVPAVIHSQSGKMGISLYKNLEDIDLNLLVSRKYRVPVFVENVVRLSALAEKHYGIAKSNKNIVFVEISNGVGAGILVEGHLFRGSDGSAGEIGYSFIGTDSLAYKDSNRGFLERIASVEGMREAALEALHEGQKSVIRDMAEGNLEEISSSTVCAAAEQGDELAKRIVRSVVDHLGVVFANMILILNPELLVVGGEISTLPQVRSLIIDPINLTMQKVIPFKAPPIRLSSLGDDAGVIGASHLAIESLLMRDFPYTMAELPEDQ